MVPGDNMGPPPSLLPSLIHPQSEARPCSSSDPKGLGAVEPSLWWGSEPGLSWLVFSDLGKVLDTQRKGLIHWVALTATGSLSQLRARSPRGQRFSLAQLKR